MASSNAFSESRFWTLDKGNEQNNIPIAYREDNADEDFTFLPQFIEVAVFFQNEMFHVRLTHFGLVKICRPQNLE